MFRFIHTLSDGPLFHIRLNRPEKRNALSGILVEELKEALVAAANDSLCRVIILSAEGSVFSAGADLDHLQKLMQNTQEENLADSRALADLFRMIYLHPKVIITQIEGAAIAGGCGLACMGDFSFAVPEATFGYTEVKIGFIPAIVSIFLIRRIGETKARDILLSGSIFNAEEAFQIGMITRVIEPQHIKEYVHQFAMKLSAETSPESIRLTKELIHGVQERTFYEALDYTAEMNAKARATEDCKKGITAFLEKRKLNWLTPSSR